MSEMFFTSTEAAKITGCTPRQLQYWRQKAVVLPTVNTTGTGRNVYYSVADLLTLKAMEYLLSMGLSFEVAREILSAQGTRAWVLYQLFESGSPKALYVMAEEAAAETVPS